MKEGPKSVVYDIGKCSRQCYGSIKVLCMILVDVVGNVMALLKCSV